MARWNVVHEFSVGVDVKDLVPTYPSIGLSLFYNSNKLIRIEHEFDTDDALDPIQAISTSNEALKLFWELLQYRRGIALPHCTSTARKLQPVNGSSPMGVRFADIGARVSICLPVVLPNPGFFSHADNRLVAWLRLANEAATSNTGADAIRNYYMIWEDLHPRWKSGRGPKEADELSYVRDFVSHGEEIKNADVLEFIKRKLGKPVKQFDPSDVAQLQFVALQRTAARNLVEKELNKLL